MEDYRMKDISLSQWDSDEQETENQETQWFIKPVSTETEKCNPRHFLRKNRRNRRRGFYKIKKKIRNKMR